MYYYHYIIDCWYVKALFAGFLADFRLCAGKFNRFEGKNLQQTGNVLSVDISGGCGYTISE